MQRDWQDLPLTGADSDAAAHLETFLVDFQNFADGAGAVRDIAGDAPGCLVVPVYAAAMHLYAQVASEVEGGAQPLLERALEADRPGPNPQSSGAGTGEP